MENDRSKSPPPMLFQSAVVPFDDKVYLLGGSTVGSGADEARQCNSTIYIYYPGPDNWDLKQSVSMPVGLCGHTATYLNHTIWIIGGSKYVPGAKIADDLNDSIYALDVFSNNWVTFPLPSGFIKRYNHVSVYNGTGIFVFGGRSSYFTPLNDMYFINTSGLLPFPTSNQPVFTSIEGNGIYKRSPRALASAIQLTGANGKRIGFAYGGFDSTSSALSLSLLPLRGSSSWFAWDLETGADISLNGSYVGFEGYTFPNLTLPAPKEPATSTLLFASISTTSTVTRLEPSSTAPPFPVDNAAIDGPTFNSSAIVANFAFVSLAKGTLAYLYGGGFDNKTASSALWVMNATRGGAWKWEPVTAKFAVEGSDLSLDPDPDSSSVRKTASATPTVTDLPLPVALSAQGVVFQDRLLFFIPYVDNSSDGGLITFYPTNATFTKRNTRKVNIFPTSSQSSSDFDIGSKRISPLAIGGISVASAVIVCATIGVVLWISVFRRASLRELIHKKNKGKGRADDSGAVDGGSGGGGAGSTGSTKRAKRRVDKLGEEAQEIIPLEDMGESGRITASSSRSTLRRLGDDLEKSGGLQPPSESSASNRAASTPSASLDRSGKHSRNASSQRLSSDRAEQPLSALASNAVASSLANSKGSIASGRSSTSLTFMASNGNGGSQPYEAETMASWQQQQQKQQQQQQQQQQAQAAQEAVRTGQVQPQEVTSPVVNSQPIRSVSGPHLAGGFRPPNRTVTANHHRNGSLGMALPTPQAISASVGSLNTDATLVPPPPSATNPGLLPSSGNGPLAGAAVPTHLHYRHSHHHIHQAHASANLAGAYVVPSSYPHMPHHHSHPHLPGMLDTSAPPSYEDATFRNGGTRTGGISTTPGPVDGALLIEPLLSPAQVPNRVDERNGGQQVGAVDLERPEGLMRGPDGEDFEAQARAVIPHVPVGKEEIELRVNDIVGIYRRLDSESNQSMVRGYNFNSGRTGLFPNDSVARFAQNNDGPQTPTAPAANLTWWRRQAAFAFAGILGGGGGGGGGGEDRESGETDGDDTKRATDEVANMVHAAAGREAAARFPLRAIAERESGGEVAATEPVLDAEPVGAEAIDGAVDALPVDDAAAGSAQAREQEQMYAAEIEMAATETSLVRRKRSQGGDATGTSIGDDQTASQGLATPSAPPSTPAPPSVVMLDRAGSALRSPVVTTSTGAGAGAGAGSALDPANVTTPRVGLTIHVRPVTPPNGQNEEVEVPLGVEISSMISSPVVSPAPPPPSPPASEQFAKTEGGGVDEEDEGGAKEDGVAAEDGESERKAHQEGDPLPFIVSK
ncbi:hypothetical protein HDU97_001592 [Phlyctochytrium planicorne]|nr:hypothetical protein HDU97_001592 [Phlyctochytrium planicorne]